MDLIPSQGSTGQKPGHGREQVPECKGEGEKAPASFPGHHHLFQDVPVPPQVPASEFVGDTRRIRAVQAGRYRPGDVAHVNRLQACESPTE